MAYTLVPPSNSVPQDDRVTSFEWPIDMGKEFLLLDQVRRPTYMDLPVLGFKNPIGATSYQLCVSCCSPAQ